MPQALFRPDRHRYGGLQHRLPEVGPGDPPPVLAPQGDLSVQLGRDLGISQKWAWFPLQRIRQAFEEDPEAFRVGPVEVDETYVGGLPATKG
ncbi:MAG: hypothetical protein F4089_09350 [Gammaproteobacteria bacterium]|nr:hypothetical protein [Gammaproteobacteria bacterium]